MESQWKLLIATVPKKIQQQINENRKIYTIAITKQKGWK